MSEEQQVPVAAGYGYATDEVKVSPFSFGLNAGKAFLTKFEFIPNGGKDGAEQEALDIVFNINGTDKNYRMFPVVKVFGENNEEITDTSHPKFKEGMIDFNAKVTHILHAFLESDAIKAGFSKPIRSFKEFCEVAKSMLPTGFDKIPLDIFLQYQWQLRGDQERTFLEIPSKMKYGRWLTKAIPGEWKENRVDNPSESEREALFYTNAAGEKHPFTKNGWFMLSNFANQQRVGGSSAASTTQAATQTQTDGAAQATAW